MVEDANLACVAETLNNYIDVDQIKKKGGRDIILFKAVNGAKNIKFMLKIYLLFIHAEGPWLLWIFQTTTLLAFCLEGDTC